MTTHWRGYPTHHFITHSVWTKHTKLTEHSTDNGYEEVIEEYTYFIQWVYSWRHVTASMVSVGQMLRQPVCKQWRFQDSGKVVINHEECG
jgi:hypothetical protein